MSNQEETIIEMFRVQPNFVAEYGTNDRIQSTTEFYALNWEKAVQSAQVFGEVIGVVQLSSIKKIVQRGEDFAPVEREAQ